MISYPALLHALIKSPKSFVREKIEHRDNSFLTFTYTFVFLCAFCQYIGMLNGFRLGDPMSAFSYVLIMLAFGVYFLLIVFVEGAITGHFLKHRNVTPFAFGGREVFILVALSYLPYLFLPALSIFSFQLGGGFYFLFMVFTFIGALVLRQRWLLEFSDHFNLSPWLLVIVPTIIQFSLLILFILIISSTAVIILMDQLKGFVNQFIKMTQ